MVDTLECPVAQPFNLEDFTYVGDVSTTFEDNFIYSRSSYILRGMRHRKDSCVWCLCMNPRRRGCSRSKGREYKPARWPNQSLSSYKWILDVGSKGRSHA